MLAGPLPLNQHACRSFTTQSCMPAGAVLLYLSYLLVWSQSHYQPCWLVWCFPIGHDLWCGVSVSVIPSGVLPNCRPCLLVWCLIYNDRLTIGRVCWCGVLLSAVSAGFVPHCMRCHLVWCLIIKHAFWNVTSL